MYLVQNSIERVSVLSLFLFRYLQKETKDMAPIKKHPIKLVYRKKPIISFQFKCPHHLCQKTYSSEKGLIMHFSKNIECGIVFSKLLHQINNPHLSHDNDDKQILNNVQKSFIQWLQNGGQSKFRSVNTNVQSSSVNIPTNNNIMNDVSTHDVIDSDVK